MIVENNTTLDNEEIVGLLNDKEKKVNDLGIEKEQAVYVGDSDVDIMTAQNAGLDCISVSWGFRTRQELEMSGAVSIIDEPMDLMDIIYKMCYTHKRCIFAIIENGMRVSNG